ncbi:hypothetical protein [Mycobacterium botniense]|uniref:Uncharacterized protein n=1 Tax=Mycobacterium botniense TaxID=84962 RepID=A0A7I9XRV0_9MYCO|nr:hypothetical protein [Mycobacterium botniense]GFG72723.1 hypothetical protein MBOT_00880 [Mycobacterium botniense]
MRLPEFDCELRPVVAVIDGMPTICNDRTVIADHAVIEPLDERADSLVSVPIRSVITSCSGPSIEIGPFLLDTTEVIKLYNALAHHVNTFPSEFRIRRGCVA